MSKKLMLITRRFPYFKTEAFLESEIGYLAEKFDEIHIFPSQIGEYRRATPANVYVHDAFSYKFQDKKGRAVKAALSGFFWKSVFDHRKQIKNSKDIFQLFRFASSFLCYKSHFGKDKNVPAGSTVYTYWLNDATFAFVRLKEEKKIDCTVVSRAHRFDIYEGLDSTVRFWPYRRETLKKIDRIYSISADGKDYLENSYKLDNANIVVSKLGIIDRGKLSLNSKSGSLSIVSVSRVAPMKRVDFIFNSVLQFASENKDMEIVWTHFGDGDGLEKIKLEAGKQNLNGFKAVFKGHVANAEIYSFYESEPVDLFINLSSSEGIPVSIMEAQCYGIPVIATNVGGSGEIVNDSNGYLLPADPSVSEVVSAIDHVIKSGIQKQYIKDQWNESFNAKINYPQFTESLMTLQES